MSDSFIKNEDLLMESHKVDDSLDCSEILKQFENKISTINKPAIVGLVGPFGVGKSTMLFQMERNSGENVQWINFDAWKYPERQGLWEGFVLDFAKEISPEAFESVDKKISGSQNDDKKTLVKTFSRIPGFAFLESLNHFLETSPARRVDDIQEILKKQIEKVKKDIYVVVEDVDRSGDSGKFFLETLNQFVKNLELKHKFIVIAPMSEDSYHNNLDSYLKSVDYFDFFNLTKVQLDNFVSELFDEKLFDGQSNRDGDLHRKTQVISFLEGLFKEFSDKMTMRLLKLILRKANIIYKNQVSDGHEPDFRVVICIEASKYFYSKDLDKKKYFDIFKEREEVSTGNIFSAFLYSMLFDRESIYDNRRMNNGKYKDVITSSPARFKFFVLKNDNSRGCPWKYDTFTTDEHGPGFGIASFYLDY